MDKMVIVTGASRGIGASIARDLAEAGYIVGCLSRSGGLPAVEDMSDAVRARCIPVASDVADELSFRAAITKLAEQGHAVVGLVNNAGLHVEGPSVNLSVAEWDMLMAANATSVVIGCQAAFPHLKAAGGGLIVNIGSFFDKLGVRRNLAYCASKAAVGAISRVLAVEWATDGISVVNVAPGFIITDLNRAQWEEGPLRAHLEKRIPGRMPGTAKDVAVLVTSLFKMNLPYLSGETIYIDGGQSVNA